MKKRLKDSPTRWEIPIVDRRRRIVGWTAANPEIVGLTVSHPEAERLVGGEVVCAYVEIDEPALAQRAGAPAGWTQKWRCLGLCSRTATARLYPGGESASPVIMCEPADAD